jgi:hypothetical protein
MEIQCLKLFITEEEANEWVRKVLPDPDPIEDLYVKLMPEGLLVQGSYPAMMFKTTFETQWQLTVIGPEVVARLVAVKIAGLPAGLFKGALLRMIRDAMVAQPGVRVQDECVRIHAEEVARAQEVPLRVRFTAVRCSIASLVVEAGSEGMRDEG